MNHSFTCVASAAVLTAALPALAQTGANFNRVASFPVAANLPEGTDPLTPTARLW